MHGPDDVPGLCDGRLEFCSGLASRFENGCKVAYVPVLEDDGEPAIGFEQFEACLNTARQPVFVVLFRVPVLAAGRPAHRQPAHLAGQRPGAAGTGGLRLRLLEPRRDFGDLVTRLLLGFGAG